MNNDFSFCLNGYLRENSKLRMHLYFYVKINIFLLSQTSLLSTFCFVFQKQKQTIINAINCTFDSHVIYKDNDKGSVKILSFVKRNIYDLVDLTAPPSLIAVLNLKLIL